MARARHPNRQRQRHQRRSNPLYDPTATLAGKSLKQAAKALVNLQYAPQEQALQRAQANATAQGTALVNNAGSYYSQVAQQAMKDVATQDALSRGAEQALAASSSQSQQAMQAAAADARARMGQDAALRGPGLSGGTGAMLAQETSAQAGLQAQQAQAARDAMAQSSGDYEHLQGLTGQSIAAKGGEVRQQLLNQLANQRAGLTAQQTQLAADKGNARVQQLTQLRQTGLENLIAERGLGIKAEQLRADIANSQAEQNLARDRLTATERQNRRAARLERRGQNVTKRGQDISAEQRAADRALRLNIDAADRASRERIAKLRARGMSPDATKLRVGIDNALSDVHTDPKLKQAAAKNDWATVRKIINKRSGHKAPAIGVQAVIELAQVGYLSPDTAAALRRTGVKLPRGWRRTGAQAYGGPH